jgi:hypothetical protein
MRRGFLVLTDRRVICLDRGVQLEHRLELPLSAITSVENGLGLTQGDAKRGDLTLASGTVKTYVTRIRPWESAAAIASYVRGRITANSAGRTASRREGHGAVR